MSLRSGKRALFKVKICAKCRNYVGTCSGFTPQYKGLEKLYETYKDQGFVILGFPCNQFGGQEPGTDEEISSFCELNHGVTFPLMKKSDVNGNNTNDVRSSEYCLHSI